MVKYLAVASSSQEAETLLAFARKKMGKQDKCVLLGLKEFEVAGEREKNISFRTKWQYLNRKELRQIANKAIYFIQNWYKFDKGFEKAIVVDGISLGFLCDQSVKRLFEHPMQQLKAVSNAVKTEQPDIILTGKESGAGKTVKSVGRKVRLRETKFLEVQKEEFRKWPNLNPRKFEQISAKLRKVMKQVSNQLLPKNSDQIVFLRSGDNYLTGLEDGLRKEKSLSVYSLDEFLLKRMLNPIVAMDFFKTRKETAKKFSKLVKKYETSPAFSKNMQFKGMALKELFNIEIQTFVCREWPEFVFLIKELGKLFARQKPKALVLWSDFIPFERICAMIAKKHGIPSMVAQHGMFDEEDHDMDWIRGFAPLTVDKIAVWGSEFKKSMIKRNVPASSIVITGAPKLDAGNRKKFNPKEFRKRIGYGKKNIVSLILPLEPYNHKMMLEASSKAIEKFSECKLVVKIHPTEKEETCKRISEELKGRTVVERNFNLYELLNASTAVIIHISTVGIEAMSLEKPVIVLAKPNDYLWIYKSTDAVLKAQNRAQLEKELEMILHDKRQLAELKKKMQTFLYQHSFKQDGKATERVVQLVKEMIKAKKKKGIPEKKAGAKDKGIVLGAIIARAGSKRLKDKNLMELDGKPLIAYSIEPALKSKRLDKVIVSTDSDKIARISKKLGASVPFKRPKELSGNKSTSADVLRHAVKEIESSTGEKIAYIMLLQPTSPFRKTKHIDKAVEKFFETNANSLFSVSKPEKDSKFLVFLKKGKLAFAKGLDKKRTGLLALNGAIFIYDRKTLFSGSDYPIGEKSVLFEMPLENSVDIDTLEEFKNAEKMLKEKREKMRGVKQK